MMRHERSEHWREQAAMSRQAVQGRAMLAFPRPDRPISVRRALVYAACVIVPWGILGASCILLAGCGPDLMRASPEAVIPPDFAFYVSAPDKFPRPPHVKDCNDCAVEHATRLRAEGLDPVLLPQEQYRPPLT
jgi:hypothetical protein